MKYIRNFGVMFIAIFILTFVVIEQIDNKIQKSDNTKIKETSSTVVKAENKISNKPKKTAKDIYERVHIMTNSEVVCPNQENVGMIPVNKRNMDELEQMVKNSDMDTSEKEYFGEVLTKWRKEDLSNVIEVHNKAEKELGGNNFASEIIGANIIIEGLFYDTNPQTVETAKRIILEKLPKDVVEVQKIEDTEFGATIIIYSSKETGKKYKGRIGYHLDEFDRNSYDKRKVLAITLEEIV
jgi:hypothetical protein